MNLSQLIRFCACIVLTLSLSAQANAAMRQPDVPEPDWTLQEARDAAAGIDTTAAVGPLFALARAGRGDALLQLLAEVAARPDWPVPARERALHTFALGLADLRPDAVGPEIMSWLLAYEPRTLVPHDDFPLAGVPLFRIGAAAAGSLNAWERRTAADESARLLRRGPEAWLEAFLSAGPVRRPGFVEALDQAGPEQLGRLANLALARLPAERGLTPVAARAGVLLADPSILGRTVVAGGGPDLAPALRSAARALDEIGRAAVLRHAIARAAPVNASLAIAELAPGLLHQPEVTELLFVKLGDPEIGSAAALALSASKNAQVRDRLNELARGGSGLDARRAAIAVEASRSLAGGTER